MEEKLKEYRALRRRKQLIDNAKEKLASSKQKIASWTSFLLPKIFTDMDKKEEEVLLMEDESPSQFMVPIQTKEPIIIEEQQEVNQQDETIEETNPESWWYFTIKWTIYCIIWLTLYIFFLKVGFGAVFFVISLLIGICLNTTTRKRKQGEASAYSVFNKNCVSIDGTLKAEQFEREIRFGAGSMRPF